MNSNYSVDSQKEIVITGGAGYIGSHLCRFLLQKGHKVTVLDRFLFGRNSLKSLEFFYPDSFRIVEGDIQDEQVVTKVFQNKNILIHLAAIVGDPACSVRADEAVKVNYDATIQLSKLADRLGISRMIFSSTCSVYGSSDELLDETSHTTPVSLYGQTKLNAEEYLMKNDFADLEIAILRLGTVFGLSPRMRFDLVINYLTKKAIIDKEFKILGGNQWRPFVHVADCALAMKKIALLEDWSSVSRSVTNVGSDTGNTMIEGLVPIYREIFPDIVIHKDPETVDKRSYRVKFSRLIEKTGFEPSITIAAGVKEIVTAFWNGTIVDPDREEYYNYRVWA